MRYHPRFSHWKSHRIRRRHAADRLREGRLLGLQPQSSRNAVLIPITITALADRAGGETLRSKGNLFDNYGNWWRDRAQFLRLSSPLASTPAA